MPLAALAGGILGGPLLEAIGRKSTILSTAIPFVLASLIVTYATGPKVDLEANARYII